MVHENQILHNLMLIACVDSLLFILHLHEMVGVCFVFGFFFLNQDKAQAGTIINNTITTTQEKCPQKY